MIKPIPEATRVKKAVLLHDSEAKTYSLVHYDTEILKLNENLEILKALRCSNSSTRSIMQVADYFDIDRVKIQKAMKSFNDFYKYPVGN